ncbi:MAG: 30S ribosome-binding factor RbfA [Clostridia bacterium]|nr:30S ribosome-binding factor RbfA [Clostridia bacterium]
MSDRIVRISEEIKRALSVILQGSIKDPRMPKFVTVMRVDVTRDLKYAKVYISVMGSQEDKKNCLICLKNATGFIRREIGRKVIIRSIPELTFVIDDSVDYGFKIDKILNEIKEKDNGETN